MRRKVSNEELRAKLAALKAESEAREIAMQRELERLKRQVTGQPTGLTDADIRHDTPYRIRTGTNRQIWVLATVVDEATWKEKGTRFYRLERIDMKTQGPPILREASEIYPAADSEDETAPTPKKH